MIQITRGTTPTVEVDVDTDLTDYTCYLAIGKAKQAKVTSSNCTMELDGDSTKLAFKLTQDETLSLAKGQTKIQLRAIKDDDAIATEMLDIEVLDIVQDGVIEDVD